MARPVLRTTARGKQGPRGPEGERGPQGDQGPQGERGLPGVNAVPADEAVGTYLETESSNARAGARAAVAADVATPGNPIHSALTGAIETGADDRIAAADIPGQVAAGRIDLAATALPAGRIALYIGESTPTGAGSTNNGQYGIQAVLPQYVGTARIARYGESINGALDGRKVAEVAALLESQLDANPQVGLIICNVGTNDASAQTPLADFAASYVQIIETAKRRGIPIIATTATPRTAAWTNQATWTPRYNAWLTDYCARHGVPLADWHGALVDPATGYIKPGLAAGDGVHPNNAGHQALAAVTAPVLRSLVPLPTWLPAYGPQSNGLISNPLMAGGGPTTMPTNWFTNPGVPPGAYTRGTEDPVDGDGLPAGKWYFLELDNTAGGSAVYAETRHANITSGVSNGDRLRIYAHIKADPTSQFDKVGLRLRSGTTVLTAPFYRLVTPAPAAHVWDFTVGSTLANINVGLEMTADAGQRARAAIGAVQVYNLTTGQLVGLP